MVWIRVRDRARSQFGPQIHLHPRGGKAGVSPPDPPRSLPPGLPPAAPRGGHRAETAGLGPPSPPPPAPVRDTPEGSRRAMSPHGGAGAEVGGRPLLPPRSRPPPPRGPAPAARALPPHQPPTRAAPPSPGLTFSSPDRSPGLLFSSLLSFCFFAGISPAGAAAAGASPRSDIFPAPHPPPRSRKARTGRSERRCRKAGALAGPEPAGRRSSAFPASGNAPCPQLRGLGGRRGPRSSWGLRRERARVVTAWRRLPGAGCSPSTRAMEKETAAFAAGVTDLSVLLFLCPKGLLGLGLVFWGFCVCVFSCSTKVLQSANSVSG